MKFSQCLNSVAFAVAMSNFNLSSVSAAAPSSVLRGSGTQQQANSIAQHRILEEEMVGSFYLKVIEYGDDPNSDLRLRRLQGNSGNNPNRPDIVEAVCFDDDSCYDIKNGQASWAQGLRSGDAKVVIPAGSVIAENAVIDVKGKKPMSVPGNGEGLNRNLQQDAKSQSRTPEQEHNLAILRRQLAVVIGTKSVLVVRVIHDGIADSTALTGLAPSYTKEELADDIFGVAIGGDDAVNLHSQYFACSHGKLDFQPTGPRTSSSPAKVTDIVNGVVEVTVSTSCPGTCDGDMSNEVNIALQSAFGITASSIANHVMHCLPPGAMKGIAKAYVNNWNSVYSDNWCRYTSTQLHEIGHNLNLGHSNEGVEEYDDQTGFMGYSYSVDDQRMCFNNAKSWQLGWFSDESTEIGLNQQYAGKLKGQVNYRNGDTNSKVVVKVLGANSNNNNFYIGFNHQVKHNTDTAEAGNQVTIQEYTDTGNAYAVSLIIAKLSANTSWSGTLGCGVVQVNVGAISTDGDAGLADVTIRYVTPDCPKLNQNVCVVSNCEWQWQNMKRGSCNFKPGCAITTCVASGGVCPSNVDNCCNKQGCEGRGKNKTCI